MLGAIAPHSMDLLFRFQTNVSREIHARTAGGIDFMNFRAFRNAERTGDGPYRFVDGELLERFLDLYEDSQQRICEGLGPSVEEMRNKVEELRRMH
jgi:DNA damage-binding protein 1